MPALSNPRWERFCQEYMVDANATAAYKRVGYKAVGRSAEANAARLLRNAAVAARIDELQAGRSDRIQVTADDVLRELAKIAFSNLRTFVEWGPDGVTLKDSETLTPDQAACVSEVAETVSEKGGSLRFKLHDKVRALELCGKHLGMFKDRVVHSGTITGVMQVPGAVTPAEWDSVAKPLQERVGHGNGHDPGA